jgi:hypothetical protein
MKQETLASELGEDWSQKKVSLLEDKKEIDSKILEDVAKALNLPVEAIKNFDEDATINIIANSFHDESVAYAQNYKCSFNPVDKLIEVYENDIKELKAEIKRLRSKKK